MGSAGGEEVLQCQSCAPAARGLHGQQGSPCSLGASCGDPKEKGLDGAGSWQPLERSPHRVRFCHLLLLQCLRAHGGLKLEQLAPEELHPLWRGPALEEDYLMWLGTRAGAREEHEEEAAAQTCKN